MKHDSSEYAEILAELFVEAVQKSEEKGIAAACPELTPSLLACLELVCVSGSCSVRNVAQGLDISLSAASQLVDRLVKKNLATRRENESDRRVIEVELSDEGIETVKRIRVRRSQWFASVARRMSAEKRKAFVEGMEEFLLHAVEGSNDVNKACAMCGRKHVAFCVVNRIRGEIDSTVETVGTG